MRRHLKPSIWRISLNIGACDGWPVRETGVGVGPIGEGAPAKPILWWSRRGQPLLCQLRDFRQRLKLAPAKSRPMGARPQFVHVNKRSFGTDLWKSRSLRHRQEHRWNVTRLFLGGRITLRTAWFGLTCAHLAVALAVRPPARGMVVVCPAAAQEYFTHEMDERLNFGGLGRGSQDRLFS